MIKGLLSLILRGPLWWELEAVLLLLLNAGTATSTATGEAKVSSDFTLGELTFALRATGTVPLGDNGALSLDAGTASLDVGATSLDVGATPLLDAGTASLDVGATSLLSTGAILLLTATWASTSSEDSSLSVSIVERYPRSFFLNGFGLPWG